MSENVLDELSQIIAEVEATSFYDLPNVNVLVEQLVNLVITEDDVLEAAERLGRVDIDQIRVELVEQYSVLLRNIPEYWETVQRSVRTFVIFDRFLGNV